MSNPLSRSQAKTWTIGAQAGALLCVLGAIAVGVNGLPDHEPGASLAQIQQTNTTNTPGTSNNAGSSSQMNPFRSTSVDTLGLAERFALLENSPVRPVIADPTPETDDDVDPPSGPTYEEGLIHRRVKYIGFINSSNTQHGFIRIDGKQRIVSANGTARSGDEQFPDLKVYRVTPSFIQLSEEDGPRVTINIAEKSGPSVTTTGNDTVEVAVTPNPNGALLTEEEEADIASLPPRQQPGARRRLEREKRGLSENPVRRPTAEPLVTIRGNPSENGQRTDVQRRNNRNRDNNN